MADTFAPSNNFSDPKSFINYSRGYDTAAGAVGAAASELGGAISQGIIVKDAVLKERVNEEVRAAVEQADTRYTGYDARPSSDPKTVELPSGAVRQIERLNKMKQGVERGRISSEHYYARLATEAKRIRSEYSGYADQIDDAFKGLIGTTPANALRRQLQEAEASARSAAAAAANRDASFRDYALKSGMLPADMRMQLANPNSANDPVLMAKARYAIGEEAAFKENTERKIQLLQLQSKTREYNANETADAFTGSVIRSYNNMMSASPDYKQLMELQRRAITEGQNGGVLKGTEEQMRNLVATIRQSTEQIKQSHLQSFGGLVDTIPQQVQSAFKFLDDNLTRIEKNLTDENFGALSRNLAATKGLKNATSRELLERSSAASRAAVLEETFGREFVSRYYTTPGGAETINDTISWVNDGATADLADGKVKSLTEAIKQQGIRGEATPQGSSDLFNRITSVLGSKGVRPDVYMRFADALYGPENKAFIASLPESERQAVLMKSANPEMFKRLKEYATVTGNYQVLDDYKSYVTDGLAQAQRKNIDTVNSLNESSSTVRVSYNEKTNRFEVMNVAPKTDKPVPRLAARALDYVSGDASSANKAVRELNSSLAMVQELAAQNGKDIKSDIPGLLSNMGYAGDKDGKGNLFDRLNPVDPNNPKGQGKDVPLGDGFFSGHLQDPRGSSGVDRLGGGAGGDTLSAAPFDRMRSALLESGVPSDTAEKLLTLVDTITGVPSIMDALNKGDTKELASSLLRRSSRFLLLR